MSYIVGQGMIPFGRFAQRSLSSMAAEAALLALADAEIDAAQIGAAVFANALAGILNQDGAVGQSSLAAAGIRSIPVLTVDNACTSGSTALWIADMALAAGRHDIVLVVGAEKMIVPGLGLVGAGQGDFAARMGMAAPVGFAMRAQRYLYEFGATPEQLAAVVVKSRRHAALNPNAMMRKLETVEQVLAAPLIADPLTRSQCSPVADGAAALVLVSDRLARRFPRAIRLDYIGLFSGSYPEPADLVRWETDYRAAYTAYDLAGIGADDLDLIECHDAFSIAEILHYEALGLCGEGEGGALAASGATALGGARPVNVSGGLLSRGHPVAATAVAQVCELVIQLRGEAGERQVERCRTALAHCMGGDLAGDAKSCTIAILSR